MRLRDAIEMLADSDVTTLGPTTWADLGYGNGTFTLALADLLAPGSKIHAMDRDGSVLRKIPSVHKNVSITTHRGDFTKATANVPARQKVGRRLTLTYGDTGRSIWVLSRSECSHHVVLRCLWTFGSSPCGAERTCGSTGRR